MGIQASATCVMNFDGATAGWSASRTRACAHVHHDERGRLASASRGWASPRAPISGPRLCHATRLQGRALNGCRTDTRQAGRSDHRPSRYPPHALDIKANDRGRARAGLWVGLSLDIARTPSRCAARQEADDLVRTDDADRQGRLDRSRFERGQHAVQVFGGHGYIRECGDGAARSRRPHHPAL